MEEFLRQMPHANDVFQQQWPKNFDSIGQLTAEIPSNEENDFKLKILNALIDYVNNDHEQFLQLKITFIQVVIDRLSPNIDEIFTEMIDLFCRSLEISYQKDRFSFELMEKIFNRFQLGQQILQRSSVESIERIFSLLEQNSFLNEDYEKKLRDQWLTFLTRKLFSNITMDKNRINQPELMIKARRNFQEIYRWAAHHWKQSDIWTEVVYTLTNTLESLFDEYSTPDDARLYLKACSEIPVSSSYVNFLCKSYCNHVELFKTNELQVYETVEQLISNNEIKCAEQFVREAIVKHFESISHMAEAIQLFTRSCKIVDPQHRSDFCTAIIGHVAYSFGYKKINKKLAPQLFELIVAVVSLHSVAAPTSAWRMLNRSDFYPWKDLTSLLTRLVEACVGYDSITFQFPSSDSDGLQQIFRFLHERGQTVPVILPATHSLALQAALKWSKIINVETGTSFSAHVFHWGQYIFDLIDRQQITAENCHQFLEILHHQIQEEAHEISANHNNFFLILGNRLSLWIESVKVFPLEFHKRLASFYLMALESPLKKENGSLTTTMGCLLQLWLKMTLRLQNENEAKIYEPCADRMFEIVCQENDETLYSLWTHFWSILTNKYLSFAANHAEQFLHDIIDRKHQLLSSFLIMLYSKRPEVFHSRLDDFLHGAFENGGSNANSFAALIQSIVKDHPELFKQGHVDFLFSVLKDLDDDPPYIYNRVFQILKPIASSQPDLIDSYRDEILRFVTKRQIFAAYQCFHHYAIAKVVLGSETTADEYLTVFIDILKNTNPLSNEIKSLLFYSCQMIGARYKQSLAKKREEFLPFEAHPLCRTILDTIDGNKLNEENQAMINRAVDDIAQIEKRVVHTETNVENVTKIVRRQELKITNVDSRVTSLDNNLNSLAEQVESHGREIERLDRKTLSYVPSEWGCDVCKLLNVRANNDWRLLGKRFGYSNSELKHWAMQSDPSMFLLNEWYMTHKADEATYGLLKMLNEIGRNDVEKIIRQALDDAGQLIPDDLPIEIKRLPPVFLSYQWGSQQAVLRLKSHLEQAGYACWMDVGQMGGGDKLFAKIDAGIRGAKVVICCLNKSYAQSDNCSREVHLTISTGKPLIPMQMEKQTWPPEGALGPIMSEYLYIRFFDRKANDETYWPKDKFAELLGQIRYYVAPDPDMISEQYHNWFVPRIDNLIFLQTDNQSSSNIDQSTPLVVTHPQIMISYQWDHQKDIIVLYEKLTLLGYRCWLDILQMGGGDSLFEKIDQGIRHAKCVLSCVTPKYTKSINCRREMALADALKQPIVPLLIEETASWPPDGPMAMVFAEKPYIDFRPVNSNQERWIGKSFKALLARLEPLIPEVQIEQPQRHLLDMKRPQTAMKSDETKPRRIGSAPVIVQSRTCSLM